MRTAHFKQMIRRLDSLTVAQLDELAKELESRRATVLSYRALDQALGASCCRHCGSTKVVKNGHSHGLQRYLCRDCRKTSSVVTGTPLAGLRAKHKLAQNAECMADSLTVRETAERLEVSVSTAFRWRHRFLRAIVSQQPRQVEGLLEVDETYFLYSRKGQRKLDRPARKRGGKAKKRGLSKEQVPVVVAIARGQPFTADQVLPRMTGPALVEVLRPVVKPDTIVCSDGNASYYALPRELGITLKMFSASKHGCPINPAFHVQTVNSYHERLKTWIDRIFRGVATKYLPNYLAWQRLLSWYKNGVNPEQFITSALGRQLINT